MGEVLPLLTHPSHTLFGFERKGKRKKDRIKENRQNKGKKTSKNIRVGHWGGGGLRS